MDNSLQYSNATAQSIIEKIKSLSDSASNKMINNAPSLSEPTLGTSLNLNNPQFIFLYTVWF